MSSKQGRQQLLQAGLQQAAAGAAQLGAAAQVGAAGAAQLGAGAEQLWQAGLQAGLQQRLQPTLLRAFRRPGRQHGLQAGLQQAGPEGAACWSCRSSTSWSSRSVWQVERQELHKLEQQELHSLEQERHKQELHCEAEQQPSNRCCKQACNFTLTHFTLQHFVSQQLVSATATANAKHTIQKFKTKALGTDSHAEYQRSEKHVPFHRATSP
ncbi:MAG: hypothetical protein U0894_09475 [Pirellulales bacterium]